MRLFGKKIMELKHSYPHAQAEMTANAPRGIIKVNGGALLQSVKNSTQAKIQSRDNIPEAEKDVYEEAAKRMSVLELRKALVSYSTDDSEARSRINKMPRSRK